MDSENSEKRDLDCPDNTTCDTTFTKLLKSYKYDMRRANKETVAAYDLSPIDSEINFSYFITLISIFKISKARQKRSQKTRKNSAM